MKFLKLSLENEMRILKKEVATMTEGISKNFSTEELLEKKDEFKNKIDNLIENCGFEKGITFLRTNFSNDLSRLYTEIKSSECEFEFESRNDKECICNSCNLNIYDFDWEIFFYPNGEKSNNNKQISIYLAPSKELSTKMNISVTFEMINFNGNNNHYEIARNCFKSNQDSFGYDNFYLIENIKKDGFVKDGKVKFKISIQFINF